MIRNMLINNDIRNKVDVEFRQKTYNNSFTHGKSLIFGTMGEISALWFLNANTPSQSLKFHYVIKNRNYDILSELRGAKKTIEVKTKRTTVIPTPDFLCSVGILSKVQQFDYLVFMRVREDMSEAYMLGVIPRSEFYQKAKFYKKGDLEPGTTFEFVEDNYSVRVSDLHDISHIYDLITNNIVSYKTVTAGV